jgi:TonB-linked SusC/RagA family outer membrane protein
MAGQELNYSKSLSLATSAKYFPKYISPVSALSMMRLGLADPIVTSDNPDNKISSFFGRLNYDYKGKYLASATFRADGSSKFAPGNQWGYFPSAGLAWRTSSEKFMKSTKKWLTDLKLRASLGESGNNRISDNAWQKTFSTATGDLYASGSETVATSYLLPGSILSNPKLKWETTVTRNIGLDFGLFKNRLTGSVEVYKNTTRDLLIQATIPANTGYTRQWQNIGQTSNKGLEIVLNGVIIEKKDFRLSGSFNIGFNKNHIDKLGDAKQWVQASNWNSAGPSGDYLIKEGGEIGVMYGFVTDGMYSFDDFTYANGSYTIKPNVPNDKALTGAMRFEPGSLKLKDQNGDFVINDADKVVIGHASPKHTGGFNLTAQYKGFDCSAFFNWVYGNNIYNAVKLGGTTFYGAIYYKSLLNIMNSDNRFVYNDKVTGALVTDPTQLAELNKNATIWAASMGQIPLHSWGIEDGSFLRLNNFTIGYSLPKNLLASWHIDQLRLYVTGYNLWIWTKYSGYDPEVDTRRDTPLTPGIDWNAYPRSRNFNFGINLTF